jgi:hypothetical protein
VIADVEEFDPVGVVFGKFEKRARTGGNDPAAKFERL